jgi:Zn-finger protein
MEKSCSYCGRNQATELAVLQDGPSVRLCADCLWLHANMGWLVDDTAITSAQQHEFNVEGKIVVPPVS